MCLRTCFNEAESNLKKYNKNFLRFSFLFLLMLDDIAIFNKHMLVSSKLIPSRIYQRNP